MGLYLSKKASIMSMTSSEQVKHILMQIQLFNSKAVLVPAKFE